MRKQPVRNAIPIRPSQTARRRVGHRGPSAHARAKNPTPYEMDCNSPSGSAPASPSSQSRSTTPTIRRESRSRRRMGNDAMAGHSQNVGRRVAGITHGTRPIAIDERRPPIGACPLTEKRRRGVRTRSLAGPEEAIPPMNTRRANLRNRPRNFIPRIGGLLRGFRRRTLPAPARRPGRMWRRFSGQAWGRLRVRR